MNRTASRIGESSNNNLRIALHYIEAFKILYNSSQYQDVIVLPALFMVRQFLELGLKYNIQKLNAISASNNLMGLDKSGMLTLYSVHSLTSLHNAYVEHYVSAKKQKKLSGLKDQKFLDDLRQLVDIVSPLDEGSQGFRYAENTSGAKIIDRSEVFNLKEVYELLEDVTVLLSHTEDVFGLS